MAIRESMNPRNVIKAVRSLGMMPWPQRILGPCPTMREWNRFCWALFLGSICLPLMFVLGINLKSGAPTDFVYFYGIGQLVNAHPAVKLYDWDLQQKIFDGIIHLRNGFYGPSPYPPFVALFFSLPARLPFKAAFVLWMGISLALYSAGLAALLKEIFRGERLKKWLIIGFALAFHPFLVGTFANGQLTSIAFCSIGLAISQDLRGRRFHSGLALALLAYKPTLLLLLIPMLLLTRRFKVLLGFLTGAVTFGLVSTALTGMQIWPAYFNFLSFFRKFASSGRYLRRWQFVDLSSFSYVIPGGRSMPGLLILGGSALAITAWLFVLLWKSVSDRRPVQYLAWAAALTWTLLLNLYIPIYDSSLVVIAIFLTIAALRDLGWIEAKRWMTLLAILIFATSWITRPIAKAYGIQLVAILFLILGLGLLYLLRKASLSFSSPDRDPPDGNAAPTTCEACRPSMA